MKQPATLLTCLILCSAIVISCGKSQVTIGPDPVTPVLQAVSEFDSCNCSALPGKGLDSQYIRAEINGVPVCFDADPQLGDTFPNMLKYGIILRDTGDQYYDNLYMIRNAANSNWQAAMFFENTHALTKTFPYNLPRVNSEVCEIGELQLNNLGHYVSCSWCPENKYNYYGSFVQSGVKMIATNFENNVFEGTFEGTVRTGSGRTAHISNGRFRIRLAVYKSDIDVR